MRNLVVEEVPTPATSPVGTPNPAPAAYGTAVGTVAPPSAVTHEEPPSVSLQVQFGFGSVQVQPQSTAALRNLATALRSPQLAGTRFTIEGHTDAKGDAHYNLQLSQRRAEAVREILARFGVDSARLVSVGKGSTQPANAHDPLDAVNRRVRVVARD